MGQYLDCNKSVITAVSASGPPSLGVDPQIIGTSYKKLYLFFTEMHGRASSCAA